MRRKRRPVPLLVLMASLALLSAVNPLPPIPEGSWEPQPKGIDPYRIVSTAPAASDGTTASEATARACARPLVTSARIHCATEEPDALRGRIGPDRRARYATARAHLPQELRRFRVSLSTP